MALATTLPTTGWDDVVSQFDGQTDLELHELRRRLLDGDAGAKADRSDRDRAAHMLLYVDEPTRVLDLALDHFVDVFGTVRGDAGFVTRRSAHYEAQVIVGDATDHVADAPLDNRHPLLQRTWREPLPIMVDEVVSREGDSVARTLTDLGTTSLMATHIAHDGCDLALVCVDETDGRRAWEPSMAVRMKSFASTFVAPILHLSLSRVCRRAVGALSQAELDAVAELDRGYSYRQIASRLGKSPRTIDNQLRSARRKLGATNSVELLHAARDSGLLAAPSERRRLG